MDRVLHILRGVKQTGHPPENAEPFDLVRLFHAHCKPIDKRKTKCVADFMWICNAYITMHRAPVFSLTERVVDFKVFQIPKNFVHDAPISSMDCRALFDTLEALVWKLDGNLKCHDVRTAQWYDECKRILELVRHRAYYLATNTLDSEVHNMPEYVIKPKITKKQRLGHDTDDEDVEADLGQLEQAAGLCATCTNESFVWDFNSRLTHADFIFHACEGLEFIPAAPKLAAARELIADKVNRDVSFEPLLDCRREFEYNLACNIADQRIFARQEPKAVEPNSRTVLMRKRDSLVDDDDWPTNMEDYFKHSDMDMYRMNMDGALYFLSKTSLYDFMDKLILKNWEFTRPTLATPRIIRLRVRNTWGVVHKWPVVHECKSLVAAHVVCKQLFIDAGLPFELPWSFVEGQPATMVKLDI